MPILCISSINQQRGYLVLKHIYLVDCENVGANYEVAVKDDYYQAYYFTSGNKHINFELKPNEFELHYTHNGCKDALDFIINTYLGYLVAKHPKSKTIYHIISKDTGFDNMAGFWGEQGYRVRRSDPADLTGGNFVFLEKVPAGKLVKIRNIHRHWKSLYRPNELQELCELLYHSTASYLNWGETVALGRYLMNGGIL